MSVSIDDLRVAATRLDVVIADAPAVAAGWGTKSLGTVTECSRWLRVKSRPRMAPADRAWFGEEAAAHLAGLPKPDLIAAVRWIDDDRVIGADLSTLATGRPVATTSVLHADPALDPGFFDALAGALGALSSVKTDRVNVRQDLVARRILERFGDVGDTTVERFVTGHGDLHWANLFAPLCIVDWEGWGLLPAVLDLAYLHSFSLPATATASAIAERFASAFATRDGLLSQLFAAAELLRMAELYGDHPELVGPLTVHSAAVLDRWRAAGHDRR